MLDLIRSSWRALRRFGWRTLTRNFETADLLYLIGRRGKSLKFAKGASVTNVFAPYEKNLFLNVRDDVILLKGKGFSFDSTSEGKMRISCEPYLQAPLLVDPTFLNHLEFFNLLELLKLGLKYGVAVVGNGIFDLYKRSIKFDLDRKEVVVPSEIAFHLDSVDPWTLIETFYLGIHDFRDLDGKTVLDVGAQAGDTALYFASRGAIVYSVEPIPGNFRALLKNIQLNPRFSGRISPMQAAIGPDGKIELASGDKLGLIEQGMVVGSASAFLGKDSWKTRIVSAESYSVANIIRKFGLASIDVLKMDCKGGEFYMNEADLSLVNDMVKIEYTGNNEQTRKLVNLVAKAGFELVVTNHNPEGESPIGEHGTIYGKRSHRMQIT